MMNFTSMLAVFILFISLTAFGGNERRCHFALGTGAGESCLCFDKSFDPQKFYCDGKTTVPFDVQAIVKSEKVDAHELALQLQSTLRGESLKLTEVQYDGSLPASVLSFFGKPRLSTKFTFVKGGRQISGKCSGVESKGSVAEFCISDRKSCSFQDQEGRDQTESFASDKVRTCAFLPILGDIVKVGETSSAVDQAGKLVKKTRILSGEQDSGGGAGASSGQEAK